MATTAAATQGTSTSTRYFSSRGGGRGRDGGGFKLDALPFSVSPEEALERFRKWSVDDQGLNWIMNWNSIRIGAAYVPVWTFDLNLRYVVTDVHGHKRYDWKPPVFESSYGSTQPVVHLPGLGAYAGYSYRRSLVHPIVNTTCVFMGEELVPFEKYMLTDMKLQSTGQPIEVNPDPWNATRAQAFATLVEDLESIAAAAADNTGMEGGKVQVQTEILESKRVYLPIFLIDYSVLGLEYRAFTSGCDAAAGVSGVDHRVLGGFQPNRDMNQASQSFLSSTWTAAQNVAHVGLRSFTSRQLFGILAIGLQFVGSILSRIVMRIPPIAFLGGLFVGFRKVIQPWMDTRKASAEWESQREHEAQMKEATYSYGDDFMDNGSARRYFARNKKRILEYLGGSNSHEQGDFDWYKDYEEWARRQWQQQQQQTYQGGYGQQSQQQQQQQSYGQQRSQRTTKKQEFVWPFDPNDPYSVLGISRGATKAEVSAAFRKEMLKHHPDTQAGASEAEKSRAVERSKLISEAYRTIKTSMKR